MALWDSYGGAEVEQFRNDRSGLGQEFRQKHSILDKKSFVLLTDIAHNLLADFYRWDIIGSRFEGYGQKCIMSDLITIPGRLIFENGQLVQVVPLSLKHFSKDLAISFVKYCSGC